MDRRLSQCIPLLATASKNSLPRIWAPLGPPSGRPQVPEVQRQKKQLTVQDEGQSADKEKLELQYENNQLKTENEPLKKLLKDERLEKKRLKTENEPLKTETLHAA